MLRRNTAGDSCTSRQGFLPAQDRKAQNAIVPKAATIAAQPMKRFASSCAAILVACLSVGVAIGSAPPSPELKVVRAGDVELHYVERGSGVPVVFVHGSVD